MLWREINWRVWLDRQFFLSLRQGVLKGLAIAILFYSLLVMVYANSVPYLGLHAFGKEIWRVEAVVLGDKPAPGAEILTLAGVAIDSAPRFVGTVANLRASAPEITAIIQSLDELPNLPQHRARLQTNTPTKANGKNQAERLLVRLRFRQSERQVTDQALVPVYPGTSTQPQPFEATLTGPVPVSWEQECWLEVRATPWRHIAIPLLWFVVESLIFRLGWLVFSRRPDDDAAALFFLHCIVTVGAYVGGYHWMQFASSPALTFVFVICAMATPQVSLHFYLMFPQPKQWLLRRPKTVFIFLYVLPGILQIFVLVAIGCVVAQFRQDRQFPQLTGHGELHFYWDLLWWLVRFYLLVGLAMFTLSILSLWDSIRRAERDEEREPLRSLLYAACLIGVCISVGVGLAFLRPDLFATGGATLAMFGASLIHTTAHAVLLARYRRMVVEQIVERSLTYLGISFLGGIFHYGIILLILWLAPQWVGPLTQEEALLLSAVTILVLLTLNGARSRVQKLLDRRFYRRGVELEKTMQRVEAAVGKLVEPDVVLAQLGATIYELLSARAVACYSATPGSESTSITSKSLNSSNNGVTLFWRRYYWGQDSFPQELTNATDLIDPLRSAQLMHVLPGPSLRYDEETLALRRHQAEIALPIRHGGELFAIILVGPAREGVYPSLHLDFLRALAELASLTLSATAAQATLEQLNGALQQQVSRFARQQQRWLAFQQSSWVTHNPALALTDEASAEAEAGAPVSGELARARSAPKNEMAGVLPDNSQLTASVPAPEEELAVGVFLGKSLAITHLLQQVQKVAVSEATVLLQGESGTGKSLLAQLIHQQSHRAQRPFVVVHCAALSPGLLESELFGHVKGAFTGAHRDREGRFQRAHLGTLFLDEIGDIPLELQIKLLRVLQEQEFEPVGATEPIQVDVRILAATHQPLEVYIRNGKFREDLYYRLQVVTLPVPPLRDRREDIPELAMVFLKQAAQRNKKSMHGFAPAAAERLLDYHWPGNVRELENTIERAVVLANGPYVQVTDLPGPIQALKTTSLSDSSLGFPLPDTSRSRQQPKSVPQVRDTDLLPTDPLMTESLPTTSNFESDDLPVWLRQVERQRLTDALRAARGNKSKAARLLGLPRSTFCSKLKKLGLDN